MPLSKSAIKRQVQSSFDQIQRRLAVPGETKALAYSVGVIGAVAVGGYAVYTILNPGVAGGACNQAGSPCATAIAGEQQILQTCMSEFTQLTSQIAQSGQAPTPGQLSTLQQYQNCMGRMQQPR